MKGFFTRSSPVEEFPRVEGDVEEVDDAFTQETRLHTVNSTCGFQKDQVEVMIINPRTTVPVTPGSHCIPVPAPMAESAGEYRSKDTKRQPSFHSRLQNQPAIPNHLHNLSTLLQNLRHTQKSQPSRPQDRRR
jgi:hypothetical protein